MPKAVELLTGFVTAPSTTQTALTMATGNTLTVRSAPLDADILLLNAWADPQADGVLRIRSPRMHDDVQGVRINTEAGLVTPCLPKKFRQRLFSQDSLTVDLSGSATASDIESACLLLYYDDLPGISARFIDADTLMARMMSISGVENTLTTGTSGGYSGEEAVNAEFDEFKANMDYALLGYLVDTECACVRWRGSDTGNLGVGGPGDVDGRAYTRSWFLDLAMDYNQPLIPVMNAANADSFLIDCAQDENGDDVTVTSIFALLEQGAAPPV